MNGLRIPEWAIRSVENGPENHTWRHCVEPFVLNCATDSANPQTRPTTLTAIAYLQMGIFIFAEFAAASYWYLVKYWFKLFSQRKTHSGSRLTVFVGESLQLLISIPIIAKSRCTQIKCIVIGTIRFVRICTATNMVAINHHIYVWQGTQERKAAAIMRHIDVPLQKDVAQSMTAIGWHSQLVNSRTSNADIRCAMHGITAEESHESWDENPFILNNPLNFGRQVNKWHSHL